jgi:linoleoyl-CoA desaturase
MNPHFQHDGASLRFQQLLNARVRKYFKENHLSSKAGYTILIKAFIYGLLLILSYCCVVFSESFTAKVFSYLFFGFTAVLAGFNFAHDACHDALSKHKKLNHAVFVFLFTLQGASAYLWKKRHLESHHAYSNIHGADADLEDMTLIRLHPEQEKKWFHRFQYIYAPLSYMFYSLVWICYKDLRLIFKEKHGNLELKHRVKEQVFFFVYKFIYVWLMIVVPCFFSPLSISAMLTCFLIMHLCISLFVCFTFLISHYCLEASMPVVTGNSGVRNSWAQHQVEVSVDFHAESKWATHVFGGFNTHVAHHLFPSLSHEHYPAITPIIKQTLQEYQLQYKQFSYVHGVVSHLKYLRQLSR